MTNLPVDEPELVEILKGLSCEEQAIIRPVLERDLEFQRREKERLQKLRTNLDLEKSTISNCHGSAYSITTSESQESMASSNISSSASPSSPSRACCRCSAKLGFILNAGSKCKKCQQLVCDSCRVVPLESKKAVYCSLCFKERELQAASREWLQNTGDDVSQHLLFQMKRANRERSNSAKPGPAPLRNSHHAPPISRRNMTLPSLETMTTLAVPSEDEAIGRQLRGDITKRFWGGSPSPRSPSPRPGSTGLSTIASSPPHSANSLLAELHPREIIGSPSPRSSSANAFGRNPFNSPSISPLPTAEIAPPTPTNITHSPIAEHRRHVFTTKSDPINRNYLQPNFSYHRRQNDKYNQLESITQIPSPVEEDPFEEWQRVRTYSTKRSVSQSTLDRLDNINNNSVSNNNIPVSPSRTSQAWSCSEPASTMRKRSMYKSISRDATSYTSSVDASSQIDNSPRFIGEIQLRLTYNSSNSSLNVHVMQCRSLPHYGQHRPNPYVKIFLIGEYTTDMSQKYKTAPKKSAVDPLFNEIIKIPNVNRNHLNNHRLLVGVWHHDALGHNSPIGETIIALNSYDWKSIQSLWYPIEAKAVVSDRFQPKVLSNTPEPSTIFSIDRSRARLRPSNSLPSDYQMASNSTGYPLSYSNMSPDQVLLQRTEIINSGQSWATSRSNSDNFRNIRELEREHKKSKYQRPSFEEPESVDSGTDWTIWI